MRMVFALVSACAVALSVVCATEPANAQQVIGFQPGIGPICMGPLGPGPCALVQRWILTHPGGVPLPPAQGVPLPSAQAVPVPAASNLAQIYQAPAQFEASVPGVMSPFVPDRVAGAVRCAQMTQQNVQVDANTFLVCTRGAATSS